MIPHFFFLHRAARWAHVETGNLNAKTTQKANQNKTNKPANKNKGKNKPYFIIIFTVLSNQSSEIRLGKRGKAVAKEPTPKILNGEEFRHFYITFEPGKPIQIGVLGQKAFLKYKPSNKFAINYIGFATEVESHGAWEFSVVGKQQLASVFNFFPTTQISSEKCDETLKHAQVNLTWNP